jgi:hypothetical protein
MKNYFKTSLYLFAFATGGILFQISCSNSDDQSTTITDQQLGKIIYSRTGGAIWICDYDGQHQTLIPISLPENVQFKLNSGVGNPKLSPDGTKIFFVAINGDQESIYSCDITGANLTEIVPPAESSRYDLGGVN